MCGIFGCIGVKDPITICLEGVGKLAYRGYDSAGLVGVYENKLHFWKEIGKVDVLQKAIKETVARPAFSFAVAHTRWATHGIVTKENTHPHLDQFHTVAVVHNGIVENHAKLRELLNSYGIKFASETDTEIIAQLIAHFYEKDLLLATQKTLGLIEGSWAIAVIHKDHPNKIVVSAKESPLAIAINPKKPEVFFSSDSNAFTNSNLNIIFLKNKETAIIEKGGVQLFDGSCQKIPFTTQKIEPESLTTSKGNFKHYMLKEIFEQPRTLRQTLKDRCDKNLGTAFFKNFNFSPDELRSVEHVLILGCGSSWHAGCIAASIFEKYGGIPAQVEIASEFRYKEKVVAKNTFVIALSQSGETSDTIAAVREVKKKNTRVLAICNVQNSTLAREAGATIFLSIGPEMSVCSTKAFTSQIAVLSLVALALGREKKLTKEEGQKIITHLQTIPALAERVLAQSPHIELLAKKYSHYNNFSFLGRQSMFPTSLEAALKFKEISYIHATGYPAGEMKHGPIALIDGASPVIGLCGNSLTLSKMLNNLIEAKSRGAIILAFAFENTQEIKNIADDILYLPFCPDEIASIPFSIAAQLFAYYIAKEHDREIDFPRNLAKSVTVE
jgi:glutamine---fructose-6-phosphate transaminase (isomerizing)